MTHRFAIVVAGFVALSPMLGHAQSDTAAAVASASTPNASPRAAKKAERAADRAFAKKVRQAVMKAPGLGNAEITVFARARTGDVTLAGLITDEAQDRAAVEAARQVAGVTSVKSRLQLRLEGGQ
ncbi:BON domain-containing protein [Burkholderia sp. AU19243]|uniref:Transporter n=1 Tax=Burkholderia latens TaxID=488446 RepID=A0AAP1BYB1_9BURK|nr:MULTISPECIES: BON domain-containing protein [Burkholderia]MBR7959605.1 BON domain-containing protein [Burkholderia vietnamiensis]AOK06826.1 transporter [Burkholderia latens]KUZ97639.1 transporter [Burkholderia latens]MBR8144314.1 BON domain-containing protein [Burkholderia vietnamiensis]MBR8366094.1 BON domain-containing protein [Burkholderia sp. AU19243]